MSEHKFKRGQRLRFTYKPEVHDPVSEHAQHDGQMVTIIEPPPEHGRIYVFLADDGFHGYARENELGLNWIDYLTQCGINVQPHQKPPDMWCVVKLQCMVNKSDHGRMSKADYGYLWIDRSASYNTAKTQLVAQSGLFLEEAALNGFYLLHLDVVRDMWEAGLIQGDGMPPKE